jgi:hypothetical protein
MRTASSSFIVISDKAVVAIPVET